MLGRSMLTLPRRLLHSDCSYRTLGGSGEQGLLGIGFSLKAGGDDGRSAGLQHYSLSWCLRGHATYDDGAVRQEVVPGTLFQRFPHWPHRLDLGRDGRWAECWLALGPDAYRLLVSYQLVLPSRPLATLPLDLARIEAIRRARDALRAAREHELPLHLARILALITGLLVDARQQGRDPAGTANDHACNRIAADPLVDLQQVAHESGLGYERFRKRFREKTGMSPGAYRIMRRLDQARMLLGNGDLSIAAIAATLGYSSAFALSNQFTSKIGRSPSHYRRDIARPDRHGVVGPG